MSDELAAYVIICAIVVLTIIKRKLTVAGALAGGLIAATLFSGLGWGGIVLLGAFFLPAVAATSWKARIKTQWVLTDELHGARDIYQVVANGGIAAIIAVPAIWEPHYGTICMLLAASSLSAALADTLSSELGSLYGRRFFNILTFRRDKRGDNGVVSVMGTLIGIAGSLFMGCIYLLCSGDKWQHLLIITVAGTVGNLADSMLGATLERKQFINNNAVNMINTIVGAAVAAFMCYVLA